MAQRFRQKQYRPVGFWSPLMQVAVAIGLSGMVIRSTARLKFIQDAVVGRSGIGVALVVTCFSVVS